LLIFPEDDTEESIAEALAKNEEVRHPTGIDDRFRNRFRERLDLLRRRARHVKDMNIMVMHRGATGSSFQSAELLKNRPFNRGKYRTTTHLNTLVGTVEFQTGDNDGVIDVCVQSISATETFPYRYSIRITTHSTNADPEETARQRRVIKTMPRVQELMDPVYKLKIHSSHIQQDLTKMERRLQDMLNEADSLRSKEVAFHDQSVKLNSAVRYYPIFRILVLCFAAYLQVRLVIRYLRSRHII
jgi:emp24/gp25L/p24 family/GOLD